MRYFLTFLLLFTTLQRVLTQSSPYITLKEVSPKTMKLYQKANSLYKSDQYLKAKIQFEKILKKQPNFIDANIQLASVYYEINDYNNAETFRCLQKITKPSGTCTKTKTCCGWQAIRD